MIDPSSFSNEPPAFSRHVNENKRGEGGWGGGGDVVKTKRKRNDKRRSKKKENTLSPLVVMSFLLPSLY